MPDEFAPGDQIDESLTVQHVLGKGGMGAVYSCWDNDLGRAVAVKIISNAIDRTGLERFKREAQTIANLNHPGIVRIFRYGLTATQRPYFVMKLLTGETLLDTLQNGPLSPARFNQIFFQVLEALNVAHAEGVVHRDLKPTNIMLSDNDGAKQAVIIDFGLLKKLDENMALTRSSAMVGTPAYMSPEQCRGEVADRRSDVYSLGCVMYQCATGKELFTGTGFAVMVAHTNDKPPPAPPELSSFLERCLAKRAEDRFADASEMLVALKQLDLSHLAKFSEPQSASSPRAVSRDTRPLKLILGTAVFAVAAVVFFLVHRPDEKLPTARVPAAGVISADAVVSSSEPSIWEQTLASIKQDLYNHDEAQFQKQRERLLKRTPSFETARRLAALADTELKAMRGKLAGQDILAAVEMAQKYNTTDQPTPKMTTLRIIQQSAGIFANYPPTPKSLASTFDYGSKLFDDLEKYGQVEDPYFRCNLERETARCYAASGDEKLTRKWFMAACVDARKVLGRKNVPVDIAALLVFQEYLDWLNAVGAKYQLRQETAVELVDVLNRVIAENRQSLDHNTMSSSFQSIASIGMLSSQMKPHYVQLELLLNQMEANPKFANDLIVRAFHGRLLELLGRADDAVKVWELAINIDPGENSEAWKQEIANIKLGILRAEPKDAPGRLAMADDVVTLCKSLREQPPHLLSYALARRGEELLRQNRFNEGREAFIEAIKCNFDTARKHARDIDNRPYLCYSRDCLFYETQYIALIEKDYPEQALKDLKDFRQFSALLAPTVQRQFQLWLNGKEREIRARLGS